ncbi:MAG: DUF4214 domain-containing protein [Oscillatoria sp. SIO1A7]|nr:DUF4214 domain-containing protein [Oscillatoria sp. SIO1A7]
MKLSQFFTVVGLASVMAIASLVGLPIKNANAAGERCEDRGNWRGRLNIPDEFVARRQNGNRAARFDRACEEHQECYESRGADKSECDRDFLERLERECDRAYGRSSRTNAALSECDDAAESAYRVVSRSRESYRAYQQAQANRRSGRRRSPSNRDYDRDYDRDYRGGDLENRVIRIYREMLGINPSRREVNLYAEALDRGWSLARVRSKIATSRDAQYAINRLYREVLGRSMDRQGWRTYARALATKNWNLQEVREDLADSREAARAINRIYREVLGRNADRDGLRTYQRALARGRNLREIRQDIWDSSEARRRRR